MTIFHTRPGNQFINVISDFFSQLPFLLFWWLFCHSFVLWSLERLQGFWKGPCNVLHRVHTLLGHSLSRDISVFWKLGEVSGSLQHADVACFYLFAWSHYEFINSILFGGENLCVWRFEWAKVAKQGIALFIHWVLLTVASSAAQGSSQQTVYQCRLAWQRNGVRHGLWQSVHEKECHRSTL